MAASNNYWKTLTQTPRESAKVELRTLGIEVPMSRTGNCYDNAVMERFFWSLKHEWTNHRANATMADARLSVFRYIETFYNPRRRHQTLGYKSPDQFEREAVHAPATAA